MSEPAQCATLACDAVGLLITVLQLGQFLPQHYEMAVDKSVVGVSPWLLFFSSLYTYLAALDIILIGAGDAFTCGEGAYRCFMEDQPLLQMCGSAFLSISMWYWFLKYHHQEADEVDEGEQSLMGTFSYGRLTARNFFDLFLGCATAFSVVACVLVIIFGAGSKPVLSYAHLCGMIAAVLNALMWLPQIAVTYRYGHKGALSLGWVLASVVMDVAYSVYLGTMGMHWSVWANNVPDGVQTGILLIMLLRFEYRDRQMGVDDYGHLKGIMEEDLGEHSALVQKGEQGMKRIG